MTKDIGNERVLLELAETLGELAETIASDSGEGPGSGARPIEATAADRPAAAPGSQARRYVEVGALGRGGLGEVVEVRDHDLLRTVALKRPRKDRATPRHLAALLEEAQIQAQLEHPNIPSVHALGIDADGLPYFTMTRLHGQTLTELLRARATDPELRQRVTTARLLRVFLQIGSAVAFAHDLGVIHRDLKPDNVIIGEFGEVRLMDWGIAQLFTPAPAASDAGRPATVRSTVSRPQSTPAPAGTPGYAAPEQLRGGAAVDVRADVYGLGAVLYEMLAGRPPVVAGSVAATVAATMEGEVTPLRKVAPVSERLAAVVHKALARRPDDRYPDVLCLLHDVEAVLEGRPVSALTEGSLKRLGRFYMAQSPRYARFRTFDVDMLTGACSMLGVAIGIGLCLWGVGHLATLAWASLAVAVLMGIPPAYTALRKPRPDDPGAVIPYRDGLSSSAEHSHGGHTPPAPEAPGVSGTAATLASDATRRDSEPPSPPAER